MIIANLYIYVSIVSSFRSFALSHKSNCKNTKCSIVAPIQLRVSIMAVKLIFSRLPGGGYAQLRGGYSNLDLLAAVCVADSEMEQNHLNNNSSSSSPNSVIPRNKRSSRRRTSDSVLKCVVSAFKRLSIGGGPGNQKKRTAMKIMNRVGADDNRQPAAGELTADCVCPSYSSLLCDKHLE
ncbi:unnamed protein product [Cuscuta europaea]|uniref:Uncharacterized protein n=1 Tax=Cuscuta europaea TaxID=41803 RepID=A0A9P0ZNU3_CUSEU|nr:unnamed protein product [Cuscuta europaea]